MYVLLLDHSIIFVIIISKLCLTDMFFIQDAIIKSSTFVAHPCIILLIIYCDIVFR